ncbi:MAG: 30S ribosomal protein S3 [Mesoaciditoga sp.]|uniref:30S ribosomal protein S3 n=1 Tax=Athalassotoga TaxID=1769718 RepID=UPI000CAC519D|nr:30S ribosomal protein S3 [Athalassotoga saccharophila]PMP69905.1 MAG: 30S ribosomal protein S3 [Mesoaciditoga sp.]PMP79903.1 MAG: 30S ribosomal protein S3 [Mesoaciditoga sp.]BBJ27226.1 30S ribosomal protein S3 [Athalassotoga saccharophila]HEU23697.1 30S ribosomal protein S3 [Mesoaciditoga lauensis]
MGQKTHPIGFRLGISHDWQAKWFSEKHYSEYLLEDEAIRKKVKKEYYHAGISKIKIERSGNRVNVIIVTGRPGILIGKKGAEINNIKNLVKSVVSPEREVSISIEEVKTPELDAQLTAEFIAGRIEKRASYKRTMKRSIQFALKKGALGVKTMVGGRINGAEIARSEWYREGRVPLQTLRAHVDYGFAIAKTKYGVLGVKVWIFTKENSPVKSA